MNIDREVGEGSEKVDDRSFTVSNDSSVRSDGENRINSGICDEERVPPVELGLGLDGGGQVSGDAGSEVVKVADYAEDSGTADRNVDESGDIEVKDEKLGDDLVVLPDDDDDDYQLNGQSEKIDGKLEVTEDSISRVGGNEGVKFSVPEYGSYGSLLSEFDDYVANDRIGGATSKALSYGFEVGDMVWGKVKSHPWWPGHIFNEAFASSSVRRTRREGHVLVAFFGDSSYGWFDPAELIPFEPNYAEKSQQTVSRTFNKAVEEAVDELSRRRGLGLTCKCRNPYNFRPTNVQGYFAVDVVDYEGGGVYSVNQIRKARNGFKSRDTLSFVKQLAVSPQDCDMKSIEFIQNRASMSTFRKAVFEEFDETYAQAFGVQSARTSNELGDLPSQPVKQPPRAPLSGPLVIAETLSSSKSSKKSAKVKDHSKKDRYLFKRRDELSDSKTIQISPGKASSSVPSPFMEESSVFFAGDYVLQKRDPVSQVSTHKQGDDISRGGASSSGDADVKDATLDQSSVQCAVVDIKPAFNQEERTRGGVVAGSSNDIKQVADTKIELKSEDGMSSGSLGGHQRPDLNFTPKVEGGLGLNQAQEGHTSGLLFPVDAKRLGGASVDGQVKKAMAKAKALKRPLGDLGAENSVMMEKKKKKKVAASETNLDNANKRLSLGKGTSVSGTGGSGFEIPQLLEDLRALALDRFHGVDRNSPAMVRKFFLRFRSLVYQKSLVLSPPSEMEQPASSVGASENSGDGNVRASTTSKPVRPLSRPDDPTKAGRKRLPSDRQEENASKKAKKMSQLKSLAAEKKAAIQKSSEGPRVEVKEPPAAVTSAKPLRKPDFVKRTAPPAKVVEPTMLVMKFPQDFSLPSVAELKAKFGRFGSLDQAAIRVFWKSFTCRVVFRYKSDAQAAFRYANANNSLFGNVNVKFMLRTVEASGSEAVESEKTRGDDAMNEPLRVKSHLPDRAAYQSLLQPAILPKSILKKATGDEAGPGPGATGGNNGGSGRGTPRVKFILGGEETSSTTRNNSFNNNNASFADAGAPMEFNSKNFQKVISPSPSLLPLAPPFSKGPLNQPEVVVPRNHALNLNPPPPPPPSIDISQQMLSLLTSCNDVVANVTGLLGYVPYHPL